VLDLTDDLAASRPPVPDPAELVQALTWPRSDSDVIAAFDVQQAAQAWRGVQGSFSVIRLDTRPNIPVGRGPWGPFAAVAGEPALPSHAVFAAQPQYEVTGEDSPLPSPASGVPILVVGRDIHRHAAARAVVNRLRAEHASVLVVDMGWPSDDRRYADVATFSASRLAGRALLAHLLGEPGAV
jgi:beta-N-acetylhexosaminidase